MVELGISVDENSQFEDVKQSNSDNQESETVTPIETIDDKSTDDSIESISFIAEPSKEKRTRSAK